jgi:putative ABC transport system substrate-binding protein
MMRRMALLLTLLMFVLPVAAQQRVWRVGYLTPAGPDSIVRGPILGPTLAALGEHGFVEGRNLELIVRSAAGDPDRLVPLAHEIAAARPDVIIAVANAAIEASMRAAPQIPIVMSFAGGDPIVAGFATSLAHPGGKVTGIVMLGEEGELKRLQLLHDAFPSARRIGVQVGDTEWYGIEPRFQSAAAAFGVDLIIRKVDTPQEIDGAAAALRSAGAEAILVASSPLFSREAGKIAASTMRERLPTMCEWKHMAREGCLLSFGPNLERLRRRTGELVARILEGADPASLPIEQPDRFEFAVNLRTAKSLGIELSPSIFARADEVIE